MMKERSRLFLLVLTVLTMLPTYSNQKSNEQAILLYFLVIGAAFVIVRLFPEVQRRPVVKHPVSELNIVLLVAALSAGLSIFRFLYRPDTSAMPVFPKLLLLVAGCVYALSISSSFRGMHLKSWAGEKPVCRLHC
jgi:hypothetical protein